MKRRFLMMAVLAALFLAPSKASAFDWSSLFGSSTTTSTITNLIEGVFSKSDLEVSDLAGQWTIDGSAVSFQSDNLLQKAGGLAAASAIEAKIDPYMEQYGLVGAVMVIQTDGSYEIQMSKGSIKGTIVKSSSSTSNFTFNITVLGKSISSVPAYVQKSSSSLDLMFDSNKLKSILSTVGKLVNSSLASSALSILNSYEGLYVGFGMHKTGTVSTTSTTTTTTTGTTTTGTTTTGTSILGTLLGGATGTTTTNSNNTTTTTTNSNTTTTNSNTTTTNSNATDAISTLYNLFKNK
jgi:hypothetical protein